MSDQRCGTCRHWGDATDTTIRRPCRWLHNTVPVGMQGALVVMRFAAADGGDCPTWEAAPADAGFLPG